MALKTASLVNLKTGTRKPNAPRGPLVPTVTGPSSMYVEWGPCENDGGAPLQGYAIWIREVTRRIWIEVSFSEIMTLQQSKERFPLCIEDDFSYCLRNIMNIK